MVVAAGGREREREREREKARGEKSKQEREREKERERVTDALLTGESNLPAALWQSSTYSMSSHSLCMNVCVYTCDKKRQCEYM